MYSQQSHSTDRNNEQEEADTKDRLPPQSTVTDYIKNGDSKLSTSKHRSSKHRSRRLTLEKGSSKRSSYRSSKETRRSTDDSPSRPTLERGTSKRRSNRHGHSRGRRNLSRGRSHRRSEKEGGRSRRPSTDSVPDRFAFYSSDDGDEVVDTLYSKDDSGNKEKEKASRARGNSAPAVNPGVEHVSSNHSTSANTLSGSDAKEKAKSRRNSPKRSSKLGVEHIGSHKGLATQALYGDDEDAKAKASRRNPGYAIVPGVQQVSGDIISSSNQSASISALTENDDTCAKAKSNAYRASSSECARHPDVDRVFSPSSNPIWKKAKSSREIVSMSTDTNNKKNDSKMNTLYGEDADAKAKAKSSRVNSNFATGPGMETVVVGSTHLDISTLYGSDADTKAKAKSYRGQGEYSYASNPGVESVHTASYFTRDLSSSNSRGNSITSTLYGNDVDAKAKARAAMGNPAFATNPGMESVARRLTMASLTESLGSKSASDDEEGENDFEGPVARRLSVDSTDSESSSSGPVRKARDSRHGVSVEAMDAVRVPNDPEAGPRKNVERFNNKAQKSRKKRIIFFLLFMSLIGGAIAAAWYFLFRNYGSESEDGQINSKNLSDPTSAPLSQAAVSLSPAVTPGTEHATKSPSAPPSIAFLYEPPSESDCISISLNETIAGREEKENVDFGLDLEVVLSDDSIMTEALVQELLDAIQEKILPSLAGCSIFLCDVEESWRAFRFVIFDAFVKRNAQSEQECQDDALKGRNCHRMFVEVGLFLKGSVRFLDIFTLISNEEENFANHLGLSEVFSIVKMTGAKNLTPTSSPTTMPSSVPSWTPTEFPTMKDSVSPSSLPTRIFSGQPTRSPTLFPSSAPSSVPTASLSSPNPSLGPTDAPSETPSTNPSETPSNAPSSRPTSDASALPTNAPSSGPSMSPSILPSKSPTKSPSASPSALPSRKPSSAPSMQPTSSPSKKPTSDPSAVPSSFPSVSPSGAYEAAITDRKCPYGHPDRVFRETGSLYFDVDECYRVCLSTPDCIAFSVGNDGGTQYCMGCSGTSNLQFHAGFILYEIAP